MGVNIGTQFGSPLGQNKFIGDLISFGVKGAFVVAGLAVLFFFIMAGYNIVAGAGSGDANAAKKGREAATNALIGFVVIFVAYWIVRLIETISGFDFITNPGF